MKKLTLIFAVLFILGCSKKKEDETNPKQSVTFYCFSETGNFEFKYTDKDGWHDVQFTQHTHQVTVDVYVKDFQNVNQLINTTQSANDSLYIRAESEGKKVEKGVRFKRSTANVGIQLSQLK